MAVLKGVRAAVSWLTQARAHARFQSPDSEGECGTEKNKDC